MKKYIYLLIISLSCIELNAQIAPSPDAMGYTGLNNSADLYRGYVSEIVSIYSVTANNGYQVPIQLGYQTKGIKVNEIASSVGLGWNLIAGGAITRVMRDQPDDQSNFTQTLNSSVAASDQISGNKGYDFEKDIFYLSYPGGSAKFVSTATKMTGTTTTRESFYGLPYNDLKIEFFKTSNINSRFEITDTRGVKYVFGKNATAREITNSKSFEEGETPKDNEVWEYISTWYLEEIIFPNLPTAPENTIRFIYQKNANSAKNVNTFSSRSYNLEEDSEMYLIWRNDGLNTATINDPAYFGPNAMPTITFNFVNLYSGFGGFPVNAYFGNVDFTQLKCSEFGPCHAAYSSYTNYQSYIDFKISDYMLESDKFEGKGAQYYDAVESSSDVKKFISESNTASSSLTRIESNKSVIDFTWGNRSDISSLSKVEKIDIKDHNNSIVNSFDLSYSYFNAGCGTASDCLRLKLESINKNNEFLVSFDYMDESSPSYNLPERSAHHKDVYGYYKESVTGPWGELSFKATVNDDELNTATDPILNNEPFYYHSKNSISIAYQDRRPDIDAQANSLWKVYYSGGATKYFTYKKKDSGGICVSNVKVENEYGEVIKNTSYTYDKSIGVNAPLHTPIAQSITLFSDSPYLSYDHLSIGGYKFVSVKDELTGISQDFDFYTGAKNDISNKTLRASNWSLIETLPTNTGPPLPPPFSPYFGLPKTISSKDSEGTVIQSEYFKYKYSDVPFYNFKEHALTRSDDGKYLLASLDLSFKPFQLDYSISSSHEGVDIIHSKTSYQYNSIYKSLVNYVGSIRSDELGNKITGDGAYDVGVSTYYPSNKSDIVKKYSDTVLDEMVAANMIAIPVQVNNLRKYGNDIVSSLTDVTITTFRKQHGLIQPYQVWKPDFSGPANLFTWSATSPVRIRSTSSYNAQGLLESQIGTDGIETRHAYDPQGYLLSTTVDPGPSSLERTTSYTYEPLVGVKTITGPDNRTITNEYDSQNRLHLVRDEDNNIIKRYRYNIASESDFLTGDIHIYGTTKKGELLTFEAGDVTGYGGDDATQFKWDINGTSYEGKVLPDIPFPNEGDYDITLSMINPEYDVPFVTSVSITITNTPYIRQISGIGNYTYCDFDDIGLVRFTLEGPLLIGNGGTGFSTDLGYFCFNGGNTVSATWQYKKGNANWIDFGGTFDNQQLSSPGTYSIRYLSIDGCNTPRPSNTITLDVEQDCTGDGGGGGGIGIEY